MKIVAKAAGAVKRLLGKWADEAAEGLGVIQRQRKFTVRSLSEAVSWRRANTE